ncbi:MAG: murein biosynthesis integral membrane protein MurJ [Candidatus Taylorbacteria bacterium]|nr:murein biosynthesis integral membrane protein MurJ [Candidatus Taylorbacteria bacterium]
MKKLLKIIPAGSLTLGLTTLASYILGLLRDRAFAHTFGASRALDAYNAAFLIPDLLFNILIASGIAAAFVPIFLELFYKDRQKAYDYTNSVISGATGLMLFSAIVLFIFANSIAFLAAPGFPKEDLALVAKILRILAISPILFGISNTLGSMLVAKKRFLFYGLSPVFYNLGIIGGTLILAPKFGVTGVAIGTVLGAFFHLLMRCIDALRSGFRFRFKLDLKTQEFKKTIQLMIPKMFGHPVELAMFWGFTIIASGLSAGSVAIMSFARNFQSVPVSLIGITFSTTAFPVMAKAISDHSPDEFKKTLKQSFWLILGGSTLAAIVTFFIREPLIRIVLGGGNFSEEAIIRTATMLGAFTLAMPTESLRHLLARAFYATKNTIIPVVLNILGLVIAIGGAYLLAPKFDILSIPIAFATASLVELIFLIALLPHRLKKLPSTPQIDTEFDPHQN